MAADYYASENRELEAIMEWARLKNIPLVHHALERVIDARGGSILKRRGVSAGWPDIALMEARGGYFGMFLELKRKKKYRPSEMKTPTWLAQRAWLTKLANEHYYASMVFGQDQARHIIELYMSWPKTTFLSMVNEHVL